jgi:hypothetical protein
VRLTEIAVASLLCNSPALSTYRAVTMYQSSLLELLEALRTDDVGDRVYPAAGTIHEAVIEAELTDPIGAPGAPAAG